jgi:hypothetical protein
VNPINLWHRSLVTGNVPLPRAPNDGNQAWSLAVIEHVGPAIDRGSAILRPQRRNNGKLVRQGCLRPVGGFQTAFKNACSSELSVPPIAAVAAGPSWRPTC